MAPQQDLADTAEPELRLPEGFKDTRLGVASDLWTHYRASDIFIKPTAVSGEGIIFLKGVVQRFLGRAAHNLEVLAAHDLGLMHDSSYLQLATTFIHENELGDKEGSEKATSYFGNYVNLIWERRGLVVLAQERVSKMVGQLELVNRLCGSIETLQKSHGDRLVLEPESIAKLMVAMKCLDASWQTAVTFYKQSLGLDEELYKDFILEIPNYCNTLVDGVKMTLVRRGKNGPEFLKGWTDDSDDETLDEENEESQAAMDDEEKAEA